MNIGIIGTGYVGLVTGCCLAETGNHVMCMDIQAEKVASMKRGVSPIYEPGLSAILQKNAQEKRLFFTTSLAETVAYADIVFLALPTPQNHGGFADLHYILQTAEQMAPMIDRYKLIIVKSTAPVGTTQQVAQIIAKQNRAEVDVACNPEFLREGCAVEDFMKPERIVIGTNSARVRKTLHKLYAPYVREPEQILFMDTHSAEIAKYASNVFLATKISFMNEMSMLCESVHANVDMVRRAMGFDRRIGNSFLYAGCGYGGMCFPKDVSALVKTAHQNDCQLQIPEAVIRVNEQQKRRFLDKILRFFSGNVRGRKLAVWGVAFKPETDDIRDAPALFILDELHRHGANVYVYDPEAMENARRWFGDKIQLSADMYEGVAGAEALIILTEWAIFREPDWHKLAGLLAQKTIFDGRNIFDPAAMYARGYHYESVGRPYRPDLH